MIAILTCFKNESHILKEWIEHYKNRGIEHIYMINDFSTDNLSRKNTRIFRYWIYNIHLILFNNK